LFVSSIAHYAVSFVEAVPVGLFLGVWAAPKMRKRNLSWTWAPVVGIIGVAVNPTGWLGMVSGLASVVTMLSYAFTEITGKCDRGIDPLTPFAALKYRVARLLLSGYAISVLVTVSLPGLVTAVAVVSLMGMWLWHESDPVRGWLTEFTEQVVSRLKGIIRIVNG
jgi:hypothetical protein